MKMMRSYAFAMVLSVGAAVTPAVAAPVVVTQELTFTEVLPFGTYSDAPLLATEWSMDPWPFTDASQITGLSFWFDSTDPDYVDGVGPGGGSTWVELSFLDDLSVRHGIASVHHAYPNVFLIEFSQISDLLFDGTMVVAVGGYESFGSYTDAFTLGGLSTLRVTVTGEVPDGNPTPVPEPTTLLCVGAGLLGIARRAGRAPAA